MLGNIIGIEDNNILIKLNVELDKIQSLINMYVVFDDNQKLMVGEIVDIKEGIASVNLLGELINDEFVFGVIRKPSFGSGVKLISKEKIPMIIGSQSYDEKEDLILGQSPVYDGINVGVNINSFFNNHFAIFGSTGSGKSCSVARIFQNLFEKETSIPYKANIFIFDAYGEYHTAFSKLHDKVPEINFKSYTTNLEFSETEIIKVPLWFLGVDDIALLLSADKHSQLPIIEKALKLITIFAKEEEVVIKQKNDIIARALLDILSSGRPSPQIRDQIFSILSHFNTSELNLETEIFQPGYTRPLKQCLLIDASGKIREMELITTFMNSFLIENIDLNLPDGTFKYTLTDLKDAFDFALISEGILKSDKIYDETNALKVRLYSLVNSNYSKYFDYPEYVSKEAYIRQLLTAPDGKKAQIINFNINYIDDRFAKTLTKIYSKLLFDFGKDINKRTSMPFHIILEEAHRYVQNDTDIDLIGYNIFDRITKEGRKYGVILGLITQRPSEMSETALSQCNNFLVFKMLHPRDVTYIKDMVPNITTEIVKRLRILQPGTCIAFGGAFKVPVLVKFQMPDPEPTSNNCDIIDKWFVTKKG
ncbi:MAG: ATP-binding protein [Bacilli bacterium]|nr:ATP-binding protein [Bacilli bacterium]